MTEAAMSELLDKWAAHEPQRCGWTTPGYSQRWVRAGGDRHYFFVEGGSTTPALLVAVIEAVQAREGIWDYRLAWRMPQSSEHYGVIWVERKDGWRKSFDHYADTPAAALLGAYLNALEAEAGQ